jgi:hypothetical protein
VAVAAKLLPGDHSPTAHPAALFKPQITSHTTLNCGGPEGQWMSLSRSLDEASANHGLFDLPTSTACRRQLRRTAIGVTNNKWIKRAVVVGYWRGVSDIDHLDPRWRRQL